MKNKNKQTKKSVAEIFKFAKCHLDVSHHLFSSRLVCKDAKSEGIKATHHHNSKAWWREHPGMGPVL